MRRGAMLAGLLMLAAGCGLLNQVDQLAAFAKCQFRLASVEHPTLIGIPLEGKHDLRDFGFMDALKIRSAAAGGALPLAFTVNVEARNPNGETAAMNRLEWTLLIDGREIVSGALDRRVEIAPNGGTALVPLEFSLDLRQILAGQTLDAMLNLAFNIAGEGARPTHVTLRAKPFIMIAGQSMAFPEPIAVTAEFGGSAAPAPGR